MRHVWLAPALSRLWLGSNAYKVPQNLQDFYNTVSTQQNCTRTLKSGFGNGDTDVAQAWSYCDAGDAVFIHHDDGGLADMAVDVDGHRPPGDNPEDAQNSTAFASTLQSYHISGVTDLDPYIHPYVVFGNIGSKNGYKTFDPQTYGIEPLSVIAVVCNDSLQYGIWGDTNGDDDWPPIDSVGEAAQSLAQACFGPSLNYSNGWSTDDVLFLAFKGENAVPGASGADWAASSFEQFESSIQSLGNKLVARVGASANASITAGHLTTSSSPAAQPSASSNAASLARSSFTAILVGFMAFL